MSGQRFSPSRCPASDMSEFPQIYRPMVFHGQDLFPQDILGTGDVSHMAGGKSSLTGYQWQLMSHVFLLTKRVARGSCGLSCSCLYHSSTWCLSPSSECQGRTPGSPEKIWTVDNWLILIAYTLHVSYVSQVIYLYIQVLSEDTWVSWVLQFVAVHLSHNLSPWFLGCIDPGTEKAKPGFVCMLTCWGTCVGRHWASGEISLERTSSPANSPKRDRKAERPQSCLI